MEDKRKMEALEECRELKDKWCNDANRKYCSVLQEGRCPEGYGEAEDKAKNLNDYVWHEPATDVQDATEYDSLFQDANEYNLLRARCKNYHYTASVEQDWVKEFKRITEDFKYKGDGIYEGWICLKNNEEVEPSDYGKVDYVELLEYHAQSPKIQHLEYLGHTWEWEKNSIELYIDYRCEVLR
jgi:hypothetical protein